MKILLSKRFVAFILCLLTFILLHLKTEVEVVTLATALTMLSAIYIAGETIRKSDKKE